MERHREQGLRTGGLARCFTSSMFPPSPWHRLPVRQGIDCLVLSWKGDCCRQDQRCPDLESQGWKTLPGPNLPPVARKEAGAKAQQPCTEQEGIWVLGCPSKHERLGPQAAGVPRSPSLWENPAKTVVTTVPISRASAVCQTLSPHGRAGPQDASAM